MNKEKIEEIKQRLITIEDDIDKAEIGPELRALSMEKYHLKMELSRLEN